MLNSMAIYDKLILVDLIGEEDDVINQYKTDFLKQSLSSLKKIAEDFNQGQYQQLKDDAHYLKTSAKAIGALRCAARLQQLEEAALNQQSSQVKQLVLALKNDVKDLKREFQL